MKTLVWKTQLALENILKNDSYITVTYSKIRLYLKEGRGEACAGQDNDKAKPKGFWYDSDFLVLENLGAVPPTGSILKGKIVFYKTLISLLT